MPELIQTVSKAKFSNKLLCLNELGNLVTETQQLVGNFVNIVNNATIQNPLKGQGTAEKKNDGYAIDPEGWANVVTMKNNVSGLINDWNGLVTSNY